MSGGPGSHACMRMGQLPPTLLFVPPKAAIGATVGVARDVIRAEMGFRDRKRVTISLYKIDEGQ